MLKLALLFPGLEVLGVGKLLEIRAKKLDEVSERLAMELELDEWENLTKKGMSYILCKVLLVYNGHGTAEQATEL